MPSKSVHASPKSKRVKNIPKSMRVTPLVSKWNINESENFENFSPLMNSSHVIQFNEDEIKSSKTLNYHPNIQNDLNKITMNMDQDIAYLEGTVILGCKQGFCRIIYNSGVTIEGFYENNLLKNGSIIFQNGLEFCGSFEKDML